MNNRYPDLTNRLTPTLIIIGVICVLVAPLVLAACGGGGGGEPSRREVQTISSLSPNQAYAGGADFTLTVYGSDFAADAVVRWDGADCVTTFVSSSQLQADIVEMDIAEAGITEVTVFDPASGDLSTEMMFHVIEYPEPTVSRLFPTQVRAGGTEFTLTVDGSDFAADAVIRWDGVDRTTTFVSSSQLQAAISASDIAVAGNADITVTNPSQGINSDPSTFTIVNEAPWVGIKQLGAAGTVTYGYSVAADNSGNVIVAGYTNGALDGHSRMGLMDCYVTKYNSSGVRQFTRLLGVAMKPTYGYSVATDSNNNIYVTGYTLGNLDGQIMLGTWGMFVTKYDSDGNKQFTNVLAAFGATTNAAAITIDSSDNLYIAGFTTGQLNGATLTGNKDMFLLKLNTAGHVIFTQMLGSAGETTHGQSVATDDSGNVYVAGYTTGGLDGNSQTGLIDLFVTKYDSSGNRQFTRQLGEPGQFVYVYSAAADDGGNIYVTGYTRADLDGNTATGSTDMFLTKYDSSGTKISTTMLGAPGSTVQGLSVATDSLSNVYFTGYTDGGIDGNSLTGISDAYLVKYDSSGTRLFVRQFGAAGAQTSSRGMIIDGNDNLFVTGNTDGGLDGNALNGAQDFFVAKYDSSGVRQ